MWLATNPTRLYRGGNYGYKSVTGGIFLKKCLNLVSRVNEGRGTGLAWKNGVTWFCP